LKECPISVIIGCVVYEEEIIEISSLMFLFFYNEKELINYLINNLECCNNYFENVFNKSKSFYENKI
jgi:hypothetical protein